MTVTRASLRQQGFTWLAGSGLTYIRDSAEHFWSERPDGLRYAALDFFTGVDILLKARLAAEHWTNVIADINKAHFESFIDGVAATTSLAQSIERLDRIVGEPVSTEAASSFELLRHTRNRAALFRQPADLDAGTLVERRAALGAKQALGWFHVVEMLRGPWAPHFSQYASDIVAVNRALAKHADVLSHPAAKAAIADRLDPGRFRAALQ